MATTRGRDRLRLRLRRRSTDRARRYWDARAAENALWYVDTSLSYDDPDVDRFLADGRRIVDFLLDGRDELLPGHGCAVEIGCGLGRLCLALAGRFDRVVGTDVSPAMIERARRFVADDHPATAGRVTFEVTDGRTLRPLADASADLVLSYTVFQHIPDEDVVFSYLLEARRVLRPGGLLVFQWNGQRRRRWWSLRREAGALAARLGLRRREARARESRHFLGARIPLPRMRAAVERAGLLEVDRAGEGSLFSMIWAQRPPEARG